MESAFYDEANNASLSQHDKVGTAYKNLKRSMTLNLNEHSNKKLKPHLRAKACDILTSPDVGLLKLASPELERLIIQSCNSLISSSPSPAQFLCPKSGTDEQEGFADGFVKALAELHHQQQQMPHLNATLAPGHHAQQGCGESGGAAYQCRPSAECPNPNPNSCALLTRGSSAYANVEANGNVSSCMVANAVPLQTSRSAEIPCFLPHLLKEEPQRVPEVRRETPPLSPIDMDNQERIKAERKRMRNRVAASKCRKRKLERLSRLEEKVKTLKSLNGELCAAANSLRDEVAKLKQKVMDHVNSGCHLILAQQTQTLRGALG